MSLSGISWSWIERYTHLLVGVGGSVGLGGWEGRSGVGVRGLMYYGDALEAWVRWRVAGEVCGLGVVMCGFRVFGRISGGIDL